MAEAMTNTVHDVAAYILRRRGSMSSMKLQKLVYYAQAWNLVWDDVPLFPEEIQAWANGPVVYELFDVHRGNFTVSSPWPRGDINNLTTAERETIDAVLRDYGELSGRQLSVLTHREAPWREARQGMGPTDRSTREISHEAMADFYGAIDLDDDAVPVGELDWH